MTNAPNLSPAPASQPPQPMNFIKGVSLTFITQIIGFIVGTASGIIFNRTLGPEIVGINATVMVVLGIALQLGGLGIQTSTVFYASNKKIPTPNLVGNVILFGATIGILITALVATITALNPQILINDIDPIFLYAAIIIIPFSLVSDFIRSAFLGKQNIVIYNAIDIANGVLSLAGLIIILFVLKKGLFEIIIFNTALSILITTIGTVYFQRTHKINYTPDLQIIKKILSYGFIFFIANICAFLLLRSDIYILNQLLDLKQVGIYKIAAGYADTILILPSVIASILLPKLCSDSESRTENSQKAIRVTTFIMTSLLLPFALFSKQIIHIMYGQEFLPAHIPLLILIPGILFFAIENVMVMYLAAHNFPKIIALFWMAITSINIIVNLIIIPKIGISGAALSSTISYFLIFFTILTIYLRRTKSNLKDLFIIKKEDVLIILRALK